MNDWLYEAASTRAQLDDVITELEKYKQFLRDVAHATVNHDVIGNEADDNEQASVSPAKLAKFLEAIDPKWYIIPDSIKTSD